MTHHIHAYWLVSDRKKAYGGEASVYSGGDVDTHVSPACCILDFVQGATFRLDMAKVQFNTWNEDLWMTGHLFIRTP